MGSRLIILYLVLFGSGRFIDPEGLTKQGAAPQHPEKDNAFCVNGAVDNGSILLAKSNGDVPGPETPGVQPLVPRLKRIQEDGSKFDGKNGCSLLNAGKRVKLLLDSTAPSKKHDGLSDSTIKFEWLDPSKIRDANGRRPSDPLYDKRTLHIPPDALKKMSASQKQYWSVKSQNMDVVLFFKVVS